MRGRISAHRRPATVAAARTALVLALTLVLLPSMGSRLDPSAVLGSVSPGTATVVHLLGDEVAPVPPGPAIDVRARLVAPDALLVGVLLITVAGSTALGAVAHIGRRATLVRSLAPAAPPPGRSPPRRLHHR